MDLIVINSFEDLSKMIDSNNEGFHTLISDCIDNNSSKLIDISSEMSHVY